MSALRDVEIVASILEGYATRGIFRGFGRAPVKRGQSVFRIVWHHGCTFEAEYDSARGRLRFPLVLRNVPADSAMYGAFKKFVRSKQSAELPDHRRVDKGRVEIRPYNRGGDVSLTFRFLDGDVEYGTRKAVHFVNEIFLDFLQDGLYAEYVIEAFDLDPEDAGQKP